MNMRERVRDILSQCINDHNAGIDIIIRDQATDKIMSLIKEEIEAKNCNCHMIRDSAVKRVEIQQAEIKRYREALEKVTIMAEQGELFGVHTIIEEINRKRIVIESMRDIATRALKGDK